MSAPLPDARRIIAAMLATWPAATVTQAGAWTIREGKGGGNRVSCATENWPVTEADLPTAKSAMQALGQRPQVMIRPGEDGLDRLLENHGYRVVDPTNLYAISSAELAGDGQLPMGGGYAMWPPLHKIREVWENGGIDAARQAIMERTPAPKTAILVRRGDYTGGAAFVAIQDGIAMVHALHVLPDQRRKGAARQILKQAAIWAERHGAAITALAVTQGNTAANPLYAALGMSLVGKYHYRIADEGE